MYYNTNKASGQALLNFTEKANNQKELVYTVFQWNVRPLSWCNIKQLLVEDMHEVSIKRCITDLYKEGKLVKTDEMEIGIYGKKVHKYKLA